MFLNGILFNSEAWHGLTSANVAALEKLDKALLRSILKAHKGTTSELLYLETGAIPIKWVIAQRRINFLKHILSRDNKELIRKIYSAQKEKPSQGDFVSLVASDLTMFGLTQEEVASESMSKKALKKALSHKGRSAAFAELMSKLQNGSKGKNMKYNKLE